MVVGYTAIENYYARHAHWVGRKLRPGGVKDSLEMMAEDRRSYTATCSEVRLR